MKITDLKPCFAGIPEKFGQKFGLGGGQPFCLVKIETDEGISGWGEAMAPLSKRGCKPTLEQMRPVVLERDPFQVERIADALYREHLQTEVGGTRSSCIAAIDMALYDIIGKKLKTPVYNLIGGKYRDKVKTYASLNFYSRPVYIGAPVSIERVGEDAAKTIKQTGNVALKLGPWAAYHPNKQQLQDGADCVGAVREAIGDKMDLLIDCYRNFDERTAIKAAKMIEKYDPFYFEEPVPSDNLDVMARITAKVDIPTVTGEMMFTKYEFKDALEIHAADIYNTDIAVIQGITEMKKIASMAEAYKVNISPHSVMGPVAQAATAHFSTAIPNFLIMEDWSTQGTSFRKLADQVCSTEWVYSRNGYITVPDKPGLGIEVNEDSILDEKLEEEFRKATMDPAMWKLAMDHFYWEYTR